MGAGEVVLGALPGKDITIRIVFQPAEGINITHRAGAEFDCLRACVHGRVTGDQAGEPFVGSSASAQTARTPSAMMSAITELWSLLGKMRVVSSSEGYWRRSSVSAIRIGALTIPHAAKLSLPISSSPAPKNTSAFKSVLPAA